MLKGMTVKAYKPLITTLSKSPVKKFEFNISNATSITLLTDDMTGGVDLTGTTTSHAVLSSIDRLTTRVDIKLSDISTAAGVIWDAGGSVTGSIMYIYNGVLYVEGCDGRTLTSSASLNLSHTITSEEFTVEVVLTPTDGALYINGVEVDRDTADGSEEIAGVDEGGVGRVYENGAANRGGWSDDGQGVFNETIDKIVVWKNQIPEGWS